MFLNSNCVFHVSIFVTNLITLNSQLMSSKIKINFTSTNIELSQHLLTPKHIHNALNGFLFFELTLILVYLDP